MALCPGDTSASPGESAGSATSSTLCDPLPPPQERSWWDRLLHNWSDERWSDENNVAQQLQESVEKDALRQNVEKALSVVVGLAKAIPRLEKEIANTTCARIAERKEKVLASGYLTMTAGLAYLKKHGVDMPAGFEWPPPPESRGGKFKTE
jgi:hypothetical protein